MLDSSRRYYVLVIQWGFNRLCRALLWSVNNTQMKNKYLYISPLFGLLWFGVILLDNPLWVKIAAALLGLYNLYILIKFYMTKE